MTAKALIPPSPALQFGRLALMIAIVLLAQSGGGITSALLVGGPNQAAGGFSDGHLPRLDLNVNHASAAQLQMLPEIGPRMAARIVEDRAVNGLFKSTDDLKRVRGLGPKTLAKLQAYVIVDSDPVASVADRR